MALMEQLELGERLKKLGEEILTASRNELYLQMPFLDLALSSLAWEPSGKTQTLGTNGEKLFYQTSHLMRLYRQGRQVMNRAYLHSLFHCLFRQLAKAQGKERAYWDVACDIAIESVLDDLPERGVRRPVGVFRQSVYQRLRSSMPVLTAEGVYRWLMEETLEQEELKKYAREFLVDDHGFWGLQQEDPQDQGGQDEKWQEIGEKLQTGMATISKGMAPGMGDLMEQVQVATRQRQDYRAFLRKFAVCREEDQLDLDAFDYGFYSYGLRLYGNMPLVEPPEFREVRKIQDFVIVIDTSMSCSGELVHRFLEETYSILKDTESFFRKVHIRVLQCDQQVRGDQKITNGKELKEYMECLELRGGGGTDFRPAFAYVDELLERGEFQRLGGLIYFSDGLGQYPKKRPPYETAFIYPDEGQAEPEAPPWVIKLMLSQEELEPTSQNQPTEGAGTSFPLG